MSEQITSPVVKQRFLRSLQDLHDHWEGCKERETQEAWTLSSKNITKALQTFNAAGFYMKDLTRDHIPSSYIVLMVHVVKNLKPENGLEQTKASNHKKCICKESVLLHH